MSRLLRILIVEDSPDDASLLLRNLKRGGYQVTSEIVDSAVQMRSAIEKQPWDVITSDHSMPQFNAPAALAVAKELCPDVPFLIVSGEIDLKLAVSLMRGGARDYIQKQEMERLVPAIERELHEKELHVERKRVEAALVASEEQLREVLENSRDAFYKRNLKTNSYDYVSASIFQITGFTPEEAKSMAYQTVMNRMHPDDIESLEKEMTRSILGTPGSSNQAEYRFMHKNGNYCWIQDRFSILYDEQGNPEALIGSLSDITERKQSEEALQTANQLYNTLVSNIPMGVYIMRSMPDGSYKFEYVSSKVAEIFGVSVENFLNDPQAGFAPIHPDDLDMLVQSNQAVFKNPRPFEWEGRAVINGQTRWLHIQSSPSPLENGEVIWHGILADDTERKHVADSLRASQENLAEAQHISHMGSWEWDIRLNSVSWSKEMFRVYDIDPSTYDGKPETLLKVIHPDDRAIFTASMDNNISVGESPTLEYRVIHKDGSIHNILANGSIRFDEAGRPVRSIGTAQDITERKRILEALRESEEKYKFLHDSAGVGISYYSPDGRVISFNMLAATRLGGMPEDFTGKSLYDIYPLDTADEQLARIRTAVASNDINHYQDYIDRLGKQSWFVSAYNRILNSSNQVVGVQIIATDISQTKQAEQALLESETKNRSMIANISDVISIMDSTGTNQYLSPNIEKWFGWKPEDRVGLAGWDTVHPDDLKRIQKEFLDLTANDKAEKKVEFRYRCKDSSYKWIQLTAVNLLNDPVIHGVLMNYHDITEQKLLSEAQRLSEEKFSTVFKISPDAFSVNRMRDGMYLLINEGFTDLLGYTSADTIDKTSIDINVWHDLKDRTVMIDRLLKEGSLSNFETSFRCKNGQIKTCLVSSRMIELNHEMCLIAITRDITERKKAEEQIRQLNIELERRVAERTVQLTAANQELEAFAYSVSHDLRAPLRSMDGFSKALSEDFEEQLNDQGKHYISRIRESSSRMSQLIEDLLKLSRITRGNFSSRQVDLSGLAKNIAAELQSQAPDRVVEIEVAAGLTVQGDENLMKIVMENLLNNAFKFTSRCEQAKIQVGSEVQNGVQVFYVCDNGAGFNMAYASNLFSAFHRLHSEKDYPGNGIGLATVQRIIHRHNGSIWAEAAENAGAKFFFTLGA